MRIVPLVLLLGLAQPALAQSANPSASTADDEPVVIRGVANGATVVEVDFDKVWRNCAECKRALRKLDKLAQVYRDERQVASLFTSGPGSCQRTIAGGRDIHQELCLARRTESSAATGQAVAERFVVPEQAKIIGYTRLFLDQLVPHVSEAIEKERVARGAAAGVMDPRRTKLTATNLKRIDATAAVIRRLDGMAFTIDLPDPPKPGPASGGYDERLKRAKD